MKKILSVILCLLMLASMLASCDKQGNTPNGADTTAEVVNTVAVDISKYKIIRAEKTSEALVATVVQMKKDIDAVTGGSIGLSDDWLKNGETPDDNAFEILIGATNRTQTATVLGKIEGAAYSIETVGNKIVIVGTNDSATVDGVRYFMDTYVIPSQGGILSLPKDYSYTSDPYSVIELIKNKKCQYTVVYKDGLDTTSSTTDTKDRTDYEVVLAKSIRQKIIDLTGASVAIATDWVKNDADVSDKLEILVGETNRPETAKVLAELGAADYAVRVVGNKIVVCGKSLTTTDFAVTGFLKMLTNSVSKDAEGNKNISFLQNETVEGTYSVWHTDIPEYSDNKLYSCVDANDGQLEYYITETSAEEFKAYRTKLEGAGFSLYFENQINGNLFATYTSSETMVHAYYVDYLKAVRIITGTSKKSKVSLPNVTDETYTKITDSAITQMTLDYDSGNFGMCYVVTLEDGSFIIFDGGGSTGGKDHIRLYNLLNKLNKRTDGKIIIAAWILTHEHWDHFMVFYNFCTTYRNNVTVEQYIANTPTKIVGYNSNNPGTYLEDGKLAEAATAVGGIKWVKPHSGQVIKIRNASVEVLYTQEDIYPKKLDFFNDSTMVTRMTIAGQTIMWLGDVCDEGSDVICKMYGNYIKSDMVQVAHHGYQGGTKALYDNIKPLLAFWPTSEAEYKKQIAGTSSAWYLIVDHYIATGLGVKEIYCASPDNISITLPYTAGSNAAVKIEVPTT